MQPGQATTYENSECLSEDWKCSKLYQKVCKENTKIGKINEKILAMKKEEPRTEESLKKGIRNGLEIMQFMMLQMLGTRGDIENFRDIYKAISLDCYEKLCRKCETLCRAMEKTTEILKIIRMREKALNVLVKTNGNKYATIGYVCEVNQKLRSLIGEWMNCTEIPFEYFCFDGKDYLEKIEEDKILLQRFLMENPYF